MIAITPPARPSIPSITLLEKTPSITVIKNGIKATKAIQVCYAINESNKEREVKGLLEAMEKFGLNEGLLLTFEQTDELKEGGKTIKIMPALKWALGD